MDDKDILTRRFETEREAIKDHLVDLSVKVQERKESLVRLYNSYYESVGIRLYDRVLIKHKYISKSNHGGEYKGVFVGYRIVDDNVFPLIDIAVENGFTSLTDRLFLVSDLYQMEKIE